jgi:hypothetical protein
MKTVIFRRATNGSLEVKRPRQRSWTYILYDASVMLRSKFPNITTYTAVKVSHRPFAGATRIVAADWFCGGGLRRVLGIIPKSVYIKVVDNA